MPVRSEQSLELDSGLRALCGIAAFYRIAAEPSLIQRELALGGRPAEMIDLLRAAKRLGLKAREVTFRNEKHLAGIPAPSIARLTDGAFVIFAGRMPTGLFRLIDPVAGVEKLVAGADLLNLPRPRLILLARKAMGPGQNPRSFGFRWFVPSIWRYRKPLGIVLVASLFIQVFALVTPLFFQVVIDKVLTHKGYSTLFVLVGGVAFIGLFDVVLQYLRTYVLSHTTNRIDAELGQRLFAHLLRLPLSYFETRAAGQTVARIRELESIRAFLTGQGLFCALDVVFTFVAILVLFAYAPGLTWIVVATIPVYVLIAMAVRPALAQPVMRAEREEKLASYIQTSFGATLIGAGGQNAIQYVSRATTALLMLFGAKAVIDGELTVGALIAFNMIAAQVAQPILRLSQAKAKMRRGDQQFLPGALEILETPPAPLAITMITTICLFFIIAVVWAYFGHIDIISVARGKIQPNGRVKTIQSSEAGRILNNHAENGRHVRAGDSLIELDPREAKADRGSIAADLQSYRAEVLRRSAAIKHASAGSLDTIPNIDWPADLPQFIRAREERVLKADLAQLDSQTALLAAQSLQKGAERRRLVTTIKAQEELIAILQDRVQMRTELMALAVGSKSNLLDATQMLQSQETTLVQETGQISEIDANLEVINRDSKKTLQTFIADNSQKLDEAERQVASLTEKLAHADAKLSSSMIESPIDGVVQSSIVTTVGQVVSPGEELMRIVPDDAALEIESYLPNKDIAFVAVGQKAIVKLEAFPFTRYGTIDAVVTRVAHDAVPEPDASLAEQDPAHPQRGTMPAGTDRVQNLVYAVTLKPLTTTIAVDGVRIPLGPGMEVTTEIRTGSRPSSTTSSLPSSKSALRPCGNDDDC